MPDSKIPAALNLDAQGREIAYLRVSVTDRCNLRCVYCAPAAGFRPKDHSEILTFEEILAVVRAAVGLGVKKVRITGGEPLARRDVEGLVAAIAAVPGLADLAMTTNGVLLAEKARALRDAGLMRVNVSLDSLAEETFFRITGRRELSRVLAGLEEARRVGFSPVKINVVPVAGMNDREVVDFARLTLHRPVSVRFIELMPVGRPGGIGCLSGVDTEHVKARIEQALGPLTPLPRENGLDGPAERFVLPGALGEIGFITPVTGHPCPECNRMRLTADGKLRPCLLSDRELDVKAVLRRGGNDSGVRDLVAAAIAAKPASGPREKGVLSGCARVMHTIGG